MSVKFIVVPNLNDVPNYCCQVIDKEGNIRDVELPVVCLTAPTKSALESKLEEIVDDAQKFFTASNTYIFSRINGLDFFKITDIWLAKLAIVTIADKCNLVLLENRLAKPKGRIFSDENLVAAMSRRI